MLHTTLVNSTQDLEQILELQEQNLIRNIDKTEIQSQGFVTLHHSLAVLEQMHKLAPSVIIKDNDKVVAYALTMLKECRQLVPDLEPMFVMLDKLKWENKPLPGYRFYIVGQICIAKEYRGQGLVENLYAHHKKVYQSQFDLFVTEIATRNQRSIRAHERVGFKTIHIYHDDLDEWAVVAWDWE